LIEFVHIREFDCAKKYNVKMPAILFFRKFDESPILYTGPENIDGLMNFIKPLTAPTLFEFTEQEIEIVFGYE